MILHPRNYAINIKSHFIQYIKKIIQIFDKFL